MKMWLAWGDLAEIGEDHSSNQKSLHLSSLLFLMQLPCEYICKTWTSEPDRFILNPIH
jgi:hypothetical protein